MFWKAIIPIDFCSQYAFDDSCIHTLLMENGAVLISTVQCDRAHICTAHVCVQRDGQGGV